MLTSLGDAVSIILERQKEKRKPLAVIVAGHNGSGKSTMWNERLSATVQIPLINADRMMLSILPDARDHDLPNWAKHLRDKDESWMRVAQLGVEAFVVQAMAHQVPFATETVFSHWKIISRGKIESKIDRIKDLQAAGYFVLLLFVGLSDIQLSMARVFTRVLAGGHDVEEQKLRDRFPRTQLAIRAASIISDATVMMDNSRGVEDAFTVCRVQLRKKVLFDIRDGNEKVASEILAWLDKISPLPAT